MRPIIPITLLLAACSQQPADEVLKAGTYFGAGRDALCITGEKAPQSFAFIAFAPKGDTNCAAEGRVEKGPQGWILVPRGEGDCRIAVTSNGQALSLGSIPSSCAYYCGPGASLSGQTFNWKDTRDMLLVENPLAHNGVC